MRKGKERVKEVAVSFVRKMKLEDKICPQCGKKFEGVKKRKYCSRACQAKADYARHAEQYREARLARYYDEKKPSAENFQRKTPPGDRPHDTAEPHKDAP